MVERASMSAHNMAKFENKNSLNFHISYHKIPYKILLEFSEIFELFELLESLALHKTFLQNPPKQYL